MNALADELLTQAQVAELVKIPARTLEQMRYQRRGPAFVRFGHAIRYRRSDLEEYLERHTVHPGGERSDRD